MPWTIKKKIVAGLLLSGIIYMATRKKKSTINWKELTFISKVKENQKAFGEKVISICNDLGINPNWLMIVMNNESGLNSHIKNPTSSATGLIQFIESTAKQFDTTTAKLAKMSNIEQLDYVKKYMTQYGYKIKSAADTYLAVFYPLALFKPDSWAFPQWAVDANPIFFKNGNSKADFAAYVQNKYSAYV